MGDTVNLAARLMAQAGPGEVLATRDVLGLSHTLFLTERREPFYVKGKQHPVTAHEVGSPMRHPAGRRRRDTAHRPRRAGSARGILAISRGLQGKAGGAGCRAWDGEEQVASGVLLRIGDTPVVTAECRLYQAGTPYFPVRTLLADLVGTTGMGPAETEAVLRDVVQRRPRVDAMAVAPSEVVLDLDIEESSAVAQLDDQFRPVRTAIAVVSLMIALVRAPTLFVIEDAHWMDEASQEVLGRVAGRPWRAAVDVRSSLAGQVNVASLATDTVVTTVVELQPLSRKQAETMIAAATGDRPLLPRQMGALAGARRATRCS